jgi:hypothetical protein
MGWVVKATPWLLYPRERDLTPTVQEAGWASGPVRRGAEYLSPIGFRYPDRPARSDSLYRLRYLGPHKIVMHVFLSNNRLHCVIFLVRIRPSVSAYKVTLPGHLYI